MDILLRQLKQSKIDRDERLILQRENFKHKQEEDKNLHGTSSGSSVNSGNDGLKVYGSVPYLNVLSDSKFWMLYGDTFACEEIIIFGNDDNNSVTRNGVLLVNALPCWWNLLKNEGVTNPNSMFSKYLRLLGVFFLGTGFETLQALNLYYAEFNYDVIGLEYLVNEKTNSIGVYLCSKGIETKFSKLIIICISFMLLHIEEAAQNAALDMVKESFNNPAYAYEPEYFDKYLGDIAVISEFNNIKYNSDFPALVNDVSSQSDLVYTETMKSSLLTAEFKNVVYRDKNSKFLSDDNGVKYQEFDKVKSSTHGQMNQFTLGDVIYSQWNCIAESLIIVPVSSENVYAMRTLKDGSLVYGWTPMLRAFKEMVLNGTIDIEVERIEVDGHETFKIDRDFLFRFGEHKFDFYVMRNLLTLANKYYAGVILHKYNYTVVYRMKHFNNALMKFKKYQLGDGLCFYTKHGVIIVTDIAFAAAAHKGICMLLNSHVVTETCVLERDVLRAFTHDMFLLNDNLRSKEGEVDIDIDQRYDTSTLYLGDVKNGKGMLSHGMVYMLKSVVYESNYGKELEGNDDEKLATVIGKRYVFYGNRDKNGYWYETVILDVGLATRKFETNNSRKNSIYIQSFVLVYEYDKVIGTILNTAEERAGEFNAKIIFTGGCIALISNSILSNVTMTSAGYEYAGNVKISRAGYTNGEELIALLRCDYEKFIKRIYFLLTHFVFLGCSSYQQHFMHHGIHVAKSHIFQTITHEKLCLERILCPSVVQTLHDKSCDKKSQTLKQHELKKVIYSEYVTDVTEKCKSILTLAGAKLLFKTYVDSPFGYRCNTCYAKYSIDAWEISQQCCVKKVFNADRNGYVVRR